MKPNKRKTMTRFENAVKAVTEAYYRNELEPGNLCKCFCGTWFAEGNAEWYEVISGIRSGIRYNGYLEFRITADEAAGLKQIEKSGYSPEQVERVEAEFEGAVLDMATKIKSTTLYSDIKSEIEDGHLEARFMSYNGFILRFLNVDLFPAVEAAFNELIAIEAEDGNDVAFDLKPAKELA